MSDPIFAACDNCRYFRPGARHAGKDGVCRRNPPMQLTKESVELHDGPEIGVEGSDEGIGTMITIAGMEQYTGWPDVSAQDWCGDHELR